MAAPQFQKAEQALANQWKNTYSSLSRQDKKRLLDLQRAWVQTGRDVLAQQLQSSGMSKADAYAQATLLRVEELKAFEGASRTSNSTENRMKDNFPATTSSPPLNNKENTETTLHNRIESPSQQTTSFHGNEQTNRRARGDTPAFSVQNEAIWKAAEQGDADAQYFLARMYENGQGVQRDYAMARKWYEKAAAQGQVSAQSALRRMPASRVAAEEQYQALRRAVEQGDPKAHEMLLSFYKKNRKRRAEAAHEGEPRAQYLMALHYEEYTGGGHPLEWYEKAIDGGVIEALPRYLALHSLSFKMLGNKVVLNKNDTLENIMIAAAKKATAKKVCGKIISALQNKNPIWINMTSPSEQKNLIETLNIAAEQCRRAAIH